MSKDKIARILAEHSMIEHHSGNGTTEPREAWCECSCGIHLNEWQQFYYESDYEPDRHFREHVAIEILDTIGREEWGVGLRINGDIASVVKHASEDSAIWRASDLGDPAVVVQRWVTDWEEEA